MNAVVLHNSVRQNSDGGRSNKVDNTCVDRRAVAKKAEKSAKLRVCDRVQAGRKTTVILQI